MEKKKARDQGSAKKAKRKRNKSWGCALAPRCLCRSLLAREAERVAQTLTLLFFLSIVFTKQESGFEDGCTNPERSVATDVSSGYNARGKPDLNCKGIFFECC